MFGVFGIDGQEIQLDPCVDLVVAINSAWPLAFHRESLAARLALLDNAIRAVIDSKARSNSEK